MIGKALLPLVAVSMASYAALYVVQGTPEMVPGKSSGEMLSAPFANAVCGVGIVEAETENIAVGSPISGIVQNVFVSVNQQVASGDPIVRLDDRELLAQRGIRQAAISVAEKRLAKLESLPRPEELPAREAKVRECQAQLEYQKDQFKRIAELVRKRAVAESEFESTRRMLQVARAQLATAEADYALLKAGAWRPDRALIQSELALAKAELDKVQCDLDRLTVRAPTSGRILQVNVRCGEYVATAPPKPIVMMGKTDTLHLRVNIDDHDISRVRIAAAARARLRGKASDWVDLKFVRIEPYVMPKRDLKGDNQEWIDTRVLQVLFAIQPTQQMLFVGQELDVFIDAQ